MYDELEVGAVYRSRFWRTVLEADHVWRPRSVHRRPRVELERVQRVQELDRVFAAVAGQSMLSTGLRRRHDLP
jgi:hypothetical protein